MLGITANLDDPLPQFRERNGKIRGRRTFAYAALAIDSKYLGVDLHQVLFEVNLNTALPVSYIFSRVNLIDRNMLIG